MTGKPRRPPADAATVATRVRKPARDTVGAGSGRKTVRSKTSTAQADAAGTSPVNRAKQAARKVAKTMSGAARASVARKSTSLARAVTKAAKATRRSKVVTAPKAGPARRQTAAEVHEMFARLRDANPAPTTELEYGTPYELLVAVALSAQMTDVGVNKATRRLFPIANTPRAIADLGVEGLTPYIASVNFHRTKAANVVAMAHRLLDLHGGEVPRDREALEALPGVGRKTANVVLNTAFGEAAMAVDTHIFRVSNRTGLAPGRNVREVEDELLRTVPDEFLRDAHHWLILHGRYTCKARVPECPRCIVRDLCQYTAKTPGAPPPLEVAPGRVRKKKPPADRGRRRGKQG